MINIFLFLIFFFFIVNWFQLITVISAFFRGKIKKTQVRDDWINKAVLAKTGLKITGFTLYKDNKIYGMMAGVPFWPKMILSEGLYKNLNKDELEWVILHEAGHCVLWHNLIGGFLEIFLGGVGAYLIYFYKLNLISSILLSITFALIFIQFVRWTIEYQADKFSIERVDDPRGVITAQEKLRKATNKNLFNDENSLGRFLLHWDIYTSKRIEMAKKRLLSN